LHAKKNEPFKIPVLMNNQKDINLEAKKIIKIISIKD
jgi:hypothetical protein